MSEPKIPIYAKLWFAWGQSCTYWGNRTLSKQLYRWAFNAYTRAQIYAPWWGMPVLRRAVIRGRELDDYAGAVRDFGDLINLDPEWAEPYLQRGILHSFHGLHAAPRAIADFDQFLKLAPATHNWRVDAERLTERLREELQERGWSEQTE